VWNRPEVRDELRSALEFLTDDGYEFGFRRAAEPTRPERYLTDVLDHPAGGEFDEVVLFSGGLDSLCGAADEVLRGQRRVALVSHRPTGTVYARQRDLVRAVRERAARPDLAPLHV